jgi:hypothetical protein
VNDGGADLNSEDDDDEDFPVEWDDWMREHLNTDLVKLKKAWVREVSAPELLAYEFDLVRDVLEQISLVQNRLDEWR